MPKIHKRPKVFVGATFKTRTLAAKHKRIARALTTQAHLDAFLVDMQPEEQDFALELLGPYLRFPLPPAYRERLAVSVGGPEDGADAAGFSSPEAT